MRRTFVAMFGVVGAAVLLAGCTSGSSGNSPQSSAAASSSSSQQLDTGTYATTARGPFGVATKEEISPLESQRIAEFTTLPEEIDSRFSQSSLPYGALVNTLSINDMFALSAGEKTVSGAAIDAGMGAGFYGSAGDPSSTAAKPGASITHGVMRFSDPAAAAKGAQNMYNALLAGPESKLGEKEVGNTPVTEPGMPNSLVYSTPPAGEAGSQLKSTIALTPHRSYVIVDLLTEPATENNSARDLRRSLDLQIPLLNRFPQTPTKGGSIQQDQNKILIYTLTDPNPRTALNGGVYGPRGFAFSATNGQIKTMQQLEAAGAEHTAVAGTTVYRASTPSAATTLLNARLADAGPPAASPPGLPSAKCFGDSSYFCVVQVGRYIGQTNNSSDLKPAQQQISAQYKILQSADQNTPN